MHEEKIKLIENIYERFWKELYIVAFRRLRSEEDVEDMLQDIFLSLLTAEVKLDNNESIRAFLHQRLKSRIINFYRRQLVKSAFEETGVLYTATENPDSETRLMSRELETIVQLEINRMPEKMREVFLMSRNELKTTDEIARQLNLSNQTVRNQISSAIKRIKIAVNKYQSAGVSAVTLNLAIAVGALMLINY
jgi:RNA polymerase sigma-70 factor (ECF subfamily)